MDLGIRLKRHLHLGSQGTGFQRISERILPLEEIKDLLINRFLRTIVTQSFNQTLRQSFTIGIILHGIRLFVSEVY